MIYRFIFRYEIDKLFFVYLQNSCYEVVGEFESPIKLHYSQTERDEKAKALSLSPL